MDSTPSPLELHALGGSEAPPGLVDDLRRLLRLPPEALGKLWQVLGPCLADKLTEETEKLLDVFCSAYRIQGDDLALAIKACRFLILPAVKLDVPAEQLGADLEVLCPDASVIREVLLAGYVPAKKHIRQALAAAAVLGHGKLVVGADWRVDLIEASGQGAKLRTPVAMLTLHYQEGAERGRITLQLLPDTIAELRGICDQILPPA